MEAVAISRFAGEKPFICDLKVFFCNCGGDGRSGDGGGVGGGCAHIHDDEVTKSLNSEGFPCWHGV